MTLTPSDPAPERDRQAVLAIYAWTRLLQQAALDEVERARALAVIELNGRILLGEL